ncbi:TetR/AcrR family transcriptional regulator [Cellulomonas sp. JZ18]|uniref:TetR/AcrR family transcriptional regulator n=1 Tax=Cellulomonas sp. JZ18 TaxID=2654191 RepID=UPI001E619338|nr:TetR/AcrR family transcriptional regulator [Cellulomonas sp. JZ18]
MTTPQPAPDAAADPAAVVGGLRERKKAQRRVALVDATHRLVREHGLDGVTVEMVCAEAGVSPRTFFNYFPTKDDAVLGHAPWALDEGAAAAFVAGGPTGHLLEDLFALLAPVLEDPPLGHERMHRAIELAAEHPRLMAHHVAWMDQQKDRLLEVVRARLGAASPHLADTVAGLVLVLVHSTFVRWEAAGGDGDPAGHARDVLADLRAIVTA